jgi:hypothetical protein
VDSNGFVTIKNSIPNFSDQEVSEFIDYKQNLQEFTIKVAKFQKVLNKFIEDTGQENSASYV